jgi:flagellar FliL protein
MKADPKADAAAAAPAGSKKKLIIMILAAVLVLGAGAGGGWYFSQSTAAHGDEEAPAKEHKKKKKKDPEAKPEYVPIEAFTVNLQPENGDQYLQVQFTLQVAGAEQAALVKDNMAVVRNRVLLLLSGKKASEINTVQGKQQLATELKESITEPFEKDGDEQEVSDVLFTSFIIQ